MPYRPPLVAREFFVADPGAAPAGPGEQGLSAAEVVETGASSVTLKATASAGEELYVGLGVAGEGVIRTRLSADPAARPAEGIVISDVDGDAEISIQYEAGSATLIADGPADIRKLAIVIVDSELKRVELKRRCAPRLRRAPS
ncbi:hypothetical protein [Glycomyces arizonensis]|uniref:hypothetical protein n=1 Tax=Glycomyces arizonensis TaxID=256035 RepID=UPI00041E6BDE|nr:hypothetical protein [Glycomyces arizonensis]